MKELLSILALYNFDNTIFENMVLPDGVIKDNIVNNLLMELAELEVIYPSPVIMKAAIGFWSNKELSVWDKLYKTTIQEYNMIFNQFRTEEFTDTETRNLAGSNNETRNLAGGDTETRELAATNNETRNLAGGDTETRNLTGSNNETRNLAGGDTETRNLAGSVVNSGTDMEKEYMTGFNSSEPTLSKQNEVLKGAGNETTHTGTVAHETTDTGTVNRSLSDAGTVAHETTDTGTVNRSLSDTGTVAHETTDTGTVNRSLSDTGTVKREHSAKYEGHTGIVPVQDLLEKERNTALFNVYNFIIDSFKRRFCIMVY